MAECKFNFLSSEIDTSGPLLRLRFLRGFYIIKTRWHHGWMKGLFIFPVLLILLFGTPAFAGFFDFISLNKGMKAYESGDYATALKEWKPLAEQGHAEAQNNLGVMYDNGFGVTQDYKAAFKWYKLAAEQGYATAQLNLGVIYALGQGVTRDLHRSYIWVHFAVLQGEEKAVRFLGFILQPQMSSTNISIAKKLAHECVVKNYKDC